MRVALCAAVEETAGTRIKERNATNTRYRLSSDYSVDLFSPPPLNFDRLQKDLIFRLQQLLLFVSRGRLHDRCRRRHFLHDIPKCRRGIRGAFTYRRETTQHRGTEHHRRGVRAREHHGHVTRIREQAHERHVLSLRTGQIQRANGVPRVVEPIDDVSGLESDCLQSERVFACEIVQRRVLDVHKYLCGNNGILAHEN